MSRTVAEIQQQIQTTLVANMANIGVTIDTTQWSKFNILRMLCFTFAVCAAYIEQLMDVLISNIETQVSQAAAASNFWVQSKMFQFQYSATNPQILQLINTVIQYPVIDTSLQIISGCSVTSTAPNIVTIKLATGNPFVALSSPQLAAAQGYINQIGTGGIIYQCQSANADYIYIVANVYYNGQYASVINANVTAAINAYLQSQSTVNLNGVIKMSALEAAIANVAGVNDVVLVTVGGRKATDSLGSSVYTVLNQTLLSKEYDPSAGYTILDTTNTSLTFIAQ
jgi:hypothetical protein